MDRKNLFSLSLIISLLMVISGLYVIYANPLSLDNISLGMFLFAIGILMALGAFHFPQKPKKAPMKRKSSKKKKKR